jgi:hypothetical protein
LTKESLGMVQIGFLHYFCWLSVQYPDTNVLSGS